MDYPRYPIDIGVQKSEDKLDEGNNRLIKAMRDLDWRLVPQLVENGADINSTDNTEGIPPIHVAVDTQLPEFVELLLKHGADVNALDKNGRSVLHTWALTAWSGESKTWTYSEILECLIYKGAKLTVQDLESEEGEVLSHILKFGNSGTARSILEDLKKCEHRLLQNILDTVISCFYDWRPRT